MRSKNVQATGLVVSGGGQLWGIIVNSHSSGTLKLEDSVGGGQNLIMDTFTFPAGSGWYMLPKPISFTNGLYATEGGTFNIQLLVN